MGVLKPSFQKKKKKKKKNAEPFFKVNVNEMPVRPAHGDMSKTIFSLVFEW